MKFIKIYIYSKYKKIFKNIYVFIYFALTEKNTCRPGKNSDKLQYRSPKKLEINIYGHNGKVFKYITKM